MKIIDKMDELHLLIYKDPQGEGGKLAREMQDKAFSAICKGLKTTEWERYMCLFASNPKQLERLSGYDEDFNNETWGPRALAYLAANSMCGIATTTGTRNNLNSEMLEGLDDGIDPTASELPRCPKEEKTIEENVKYV